MALKRIDALISWIETYAPAVSGRKLDANLAAEEVTTMGVRHIATFGFG